MGLRNRGLPHLNLSITLNIDPPLIGQHVHMWTESLCVCVWGSTLYMNAEKILSSTRETEHLEACIILSVGVN